MNAVISWPRDERASRWRLTLFLCGALVAFLVLVGWATPERPGKDPFVPARGDEVLERLPLRLRGVRPAPQLVTDPREAAQLAEAELRLYQSSSDPRYLGRAEAKLSAFWDDASPPVAVAVLRAKIRAANHEFPRALDDLNGAIARDPGNDQARLERSSILTVLGRYEAARADCAALRGRVSASYVLGCEALVRGATGAARSAALELELELDVAPNSEAAPWLTSLIGELWARAGDLARAERWLRQALTLAPRDTYTLATLADVLLDAGRPAEARQLLLGLQRHDALLLRLAIAEKRQNLPETAEHVRALAERFADAKLRGSVVHRREEARFELSLRGDARRALELSLANFEVQREAWDVRLVLEAALAANEAPRARPAADFARRSGLEEPAVKRCLAALGAGAP